MERRSAAFRLAPSRHVGKIGFSDRLLGRVQTFTTNGFVQNQIHEHSVWRAIRIPVRITLIWDRRVPISMRERRSSAYTRK